MTSKIHAVFREVQKDLNACLLERESTIENVLLALLTGEHMLILGSPGTAKSMLVRALCARITDATYFEKAMSPVTVPEDLYGPIDLVRLSEHGEWVRRDTGSMSRAHIVFLDEIARSNEAIRDTLLVAMNERLAQVVGFDPYPLPLLSLFSASNSTFPEEAAAFNDRFLLREVVTPLADDANFMLLFTGQLPDWKAVNATMSLDDLRQAQTEVKHIKGTPEVAQAVLTLKSALSAEGVVVSDRKWGWCGKLLKARAWLDGHAEVDPEHCLALVHALWSDPQERKTVEREVYKLACPLALRAVEIEDMLAEVYASCPPVTDPSFHAKAENILQQLVDGHTALQADMQRSQARTTARAEQALATIAGWYAVLSRTLFARIKGLTVTL